MAQRLKDKIPISNDLFEVWKRCGGYYECPRDGLGKRLGPLVGYAGTYEEGKHYVGDVYFNFARVEEYPHVLDFFAMLLTVEIRSQSIPPDVLLGAPMGGILLASALGRELDSQVVFAEKKVSAVATSSSREESKLVLDRHSIQYGACVLIVEDVCNNFSTADQLTGLILEAGAVPIGIACALNRSGKKSYETGPLLLPVVTTIDMPLEQYRQEDPEVASDIKQGNVVWKPKNEWGKLAEAMPRYSQT